MLVWFGHSDIMRCIRIPLIRKTEFSATSMNFLQWLGIAARMTGQKETIILHQGEHGQREQTKFFLSSSWYFSWEMFYRDLIIFSPQLLHKSLPRRHAHCTIFSPTLPITCQYAVVASPFEEKSAHALFKQALFVFFWKPFKWKEAGPPVQAPSLKVPLILSKSHR